MKKVSFKQMKDGTKEDYLLLDKHEKKFIKNTPDRILKYMKTLDTTLEGYQVSRLEHSLQSATRALQEKEGEEKAEGREGQAVLYYVSCALRHHEGVNPE